MPSTGTSQYQPRNVFTVSENPSNPFFAVQSDAVYVTATTAQSYVLDLPSQAQQGSTWVAACFVVFQGGSAEFGPINLNFSLAGKSIVNLPIGINGKFQMVGPNQPACFLTQVPDGNPGFLDQPLPYNGPPGVPPLFFQWSRPDWPLGSPVNGIAYPFQVNFSFDQMTLQTQFINNSNTDSISAGVGLAAFTF